MSPYLKLIIYFFILNKSGYSRSAQFNEGGYSKSLYKHQDIRGT